MTYTPQDYEQDRKIAFYVFNKNFKGHYLKDDFIQTAVIALWQLRQKGNYKDYVNCACTTALNHMISFLRKENRNMADSLFADAGDENNLRLIDVLASEQATADDYCAHGELVGIIMRLARCLRERDRKIIGLYLKRRTQKEIAERVGVTQQCVSIVIGKFRLSVKQVLGE